MSLEDKKKGGHDLGLVAELLKHSLDCFLGCPAPRNGRNAHKRKCHEISHRPGKIHFSRCFRRQGQLSPCPISGPLQIYVCCINSLHASCWDARKTHLRQRNRFRQGKRIKEHLLTANLCLQKTFAANAPLWIISLDPSKPFDKIDCNAIWSALQQHEISELLIWVLQCLSCGQTGVVTQHDADSCGFNVRGGVRQTGVLSPR